MNNNPPQPEAPQALEQLESRVLDYASGQTAPSSHIGWFCLAYFVGAVIGVVPSFALLAWKCHPMYGGEPLRLPILWVIVTGYIGMAYAKERKLYSRVRTVRLGFFCGLLSWLPANLAFYLLILPSGKYVASWP